MRILIDLQGAQTSGSRHRGIGRYSIAFTQAILRNRKEHDFHLALNGRFEESVSEIRQKFRELLPQDNIHVWDQLPSVAHAVSNSEGRRIASQNIREYFIRRLKPDILHISSLFEGLVDDGLCSIGNIYNDLLTSVTVYDLIPLINRIEYLPDPGVSAWYMDRIDHLRRADAFLTISESARQEIVDHLGVSPDASVSVGTAADPQFIDEDISSQREADTREKFGLSKPFVMYTGGIDPRKNIERLISAYASLPKSLRATHQLAIVCSAQERDRERLQNLAISEGLGNDELVMTGFVTEDDLVTLYNLTKLFVFPSWHEGFGLPALEAMQCGAPVIASNRSSLPEVVGIDAAMFNPFDIAEMSGLIRKGLEDQNYRTLLLKNAKQQAQKFDWDECGRKAVETFERMHGQAKPRIRLLDHRPRLAYVSPMSPSRTGIADYSAELLVELSAHYHVEVVVTDSVVSHVDFPLSPQTIRVVGASEFGRNWEKYDRIIYHFGNSDNHDYMFPLLEKTSGVVVLHDFYLSGIVSYREWHNQAPHGWSHELYRSHGYPALINLRDAEDVYDTVWKYPCSRSVIDQASRVIVHSRNSINLARKWYGDALAGKLRLIPHLRTPAPADVDKAAIRSELGFGPNDLLICAFGVIGPTKLSHELVEAWFASRLSSDRKCKLIFVGRNDPGEYGAELQRRISMRKSARITITGWTDAQLFKKYLAIADVGVQLRTLSRGETSGTVLDCMNYSVPLIVNDNGGMAELAGDAAIVLEDRFDVADLAKALEVLAGSSSKRSELGANGVRKIVTEHSPASCAEAYKATIEAAHVDVCLTNRLLTASGRAGLSQFEIAQFSSIVSSIVADESPRLFVDVTPIARADAGTGIQRVVRNVLARLLTTDFEHFRVEPVFVDPEAGKFRFARKFTTSFLNVSEGVLDDDIVDFSEADKLLLLDLNPVLLKFVRNEIARQKHRGVEVISVVYDLLPIKHPEMFPEDAEEGHQNWLRIVAEGTAAVCISEAVAADLRHYLDEHSPGNPLRICHFRLGSELDQDYEAKAIKDGGSIGAADVRATPFFLMVGTVEPRKGYSEVLDAFEALWERNESVELQIVGKQGWKAEQTADQLERLAASRPLKWHRFVPDAELDALYRNADCLIAASIDEGFGLPLVEAARRGLHLIARDIPVFREVCGDGATYFSDNLAQVLGSWLCEYRDGKAQRSAAVSHTSWAESVDALLREIFSSEQLGIRT